MSASFLSDYVSISVLATSVYYLSNAAQPLDTSEMLAPVGTFLGTPQGYAGTTPCYRYRSAFPV